MKPPQLDQYFGWLNHASSISWRGRVTQVTGNLVESEGPFCSVGESCEIISPEGEHLPGEIIGFRNSTVLSMLLDRPQGVRYGDHILTWGTRPSWRVGPGMLGRVLDANGRALDGRSDYTAKEKLPLEGLPPVATERVPIQEALSCGIRAIDGFMTCGRGQRLGIFGGSGVGKTTLIGMMTRGTSADLTVLALVGERGREVNDFLEVLGEARSRSVVIVSTSDQSPLLRIRAALAATTVAEYFQNQGKNVLLVVDSLTRFAMAQREIGLAAGEPPTAKGYTPSVLNLLARLVERAGRIRRGSITAFYTVLMEGDDQQDPIVDTVRSLLDGHIVLDRNLAARNHYPPISVLDSLSRLMPSVSGPEHLAKVKRLRLLLAAYQKSEDLIRIGAYQAGSDPILDSALTVIPKLDALLQQTPSEKTNLEETVKALLELPS